jgi:hypothetical protein
MNSLDLFLVQYGLTAIFILLPVKTIGVPIPIPADLIILTAAAFTFPLAIWVDRFSPSSGMCYHYRG